MAGLTGLNISLFFTVIWELKRKAFGRPPGGLTGLNISLFFTGRWELERKRLLAGLMAGLQD